MLAHIALNKLAIDSSLIHVADAGHAYHQDTEPWATSAAYPRRADEFRAATAAAARAHPDSTFYVAGASPFVSSTAALLRNSGITDSQIREDKYLFYKPRTGAQPGTATTTRRLTTSGTHHERNPV